eukprot:1106046-Alexandrium_andersonii.AAC.1
MSASLVGSEMCIRDRAVALRVRVRLRGRKYMRLRTGLGCVDACIRSPVSYTHLTLPTICSV